MTHCNKGFAPQIMHNRDNLLMCGVLSNRRHPGYMRSPTQQTKVTMEASTILERFGLDPQYGFVTCVRGRASQTLPDEFAPWERLAADLPALTATGRIRPLVEELPLVDVAPLLGQKGACERAYRLASFIAHAYVRGRLHDPPLSRIPEALARPWQLLADALGTLPVSTYCSTVLYNFRLLDPSKPLSLENAWTLCTNSGSIDESWFYLVALMIDGRSGEIIRLIIDAANAANSRSHGVLSSRLASLASEIKGIENILMRMYEENIPAVFYQRIRRYLSGWLNDDELPEGLLYGNDPVPKRLAGGSAAQSPLIQCLDIALGIRHAELQTEEANTGVGSVGRYLREMRRYMSREHRDFLDWLEKNVNLQEALVNSDAPSSVQSAFNECIRALRSFRDKHLAMVSTYVSVQATKVAGKQAAKGTGGSNPIPFLKEVRSHMDELEIDNKGSVDQKETQTR